MPLWLGGVVVAGEAALHALLLRILGELVSGPSNDHRDPGECIVKRQSDDLNFCQLRFSVLPMTCNLKLEVAPVRNLAHDLVQVTLVSTQTCGEEPTTTNILTMKCRFLLTESPDQIVFYIKKDKGIVTFR
jgi:hypothetical protein